MKETTRSTGEAASHGAGPRDDFEMTAVPTRWVGPDGIVLRANRAELALLGYSRDEYVGHQMSEFFIHPAVAEEFMRRLHAGEPVADFDVLMACRDGTIKHVTTSAKASWKDGSLVRAHCVTHLAGQGQAADEAHALLAAIVTSSDDAIVSKTLDGVVTSWNPGAERLFGYAAEEAVGQHITLIIPEDKLEEEKSVLAQIQKGEKVDHIRTVRVRKDGQRLDISLSISPVFDGSGRIIGASKVARDLTEQERVQMALRKSNERFRRLVETATEGIMEIDGEGRLTYANQRMASMLGYPLDMMVGTSAFELVHPDDMSLAKSRMKERMRGLDSTGEWRYRRADGTYVWTLVSSAPLKDEAGNVVGSFAMVTDIQERKEIGQALQREQELLRTVIDSIPAMITLTEPGTATIRLNREFERAMGWASGEASEDALLEACCPDEAQREGFMDFMRRCPEGWMDVRMRTRSGESVEVSWASVGLSEGTRVGIGIEIGERKAAEEALRESEERYRFMAESIPQIVWTARPDGVTTYHNHRLEELTGATRAELRRLGWIHFRHPDDRPRATELWAHSVRTGEPYECEYRLKSVTGEWRWHLARAVARRNRDGEIVQWFGTCTDIHDQKDMEDALREADRRKDQFLATLAHELRNPLAPIRNAVELLRLKGPADPETGWGREVIGRQVGHLTRLIDDLLDVGRITRNRLELKKQRVDLAEVVQSALESTRPLIEESGHHLTVVLPPEPVWLDADLVRLAQVFVNLLANATKYTEPGGQISLTAGLEGSYVRIVVKDNGIGIPPEDLSRLFDMFFQVDDTIGRAKGGLGIGLSLVRWLVELHGGTVTAKSEGRGKGSEFTVVLPTEVHQSALHLTPKAEGEKGLVTGKRIVVVEDNRDILKTLALLLEMDGHDVTTATDGIEGFELIDRVRPDVALLDIGIPRMDGYELCRRVRGEPWGKGLFMAALTGWGHEEDRKKTVDAGFDAHLVKPVGHSDLTELLLRCPVPER